MVSVKKSRNSSTVGNHELLKGVDGDGSNCVADPFSNEILLGPFDWARLAVGSVVLMPVRAIAVILTLVMVRSFLFQLKEEFLQHPCIPLSVISLPIVKLKDSIAI